MLPKYVSVDDLAGHDSASVKSYDFTDVPLDDASQIHHERAETKNEADEDMQWDHRESDHVVPRMDPSSPSESTAAHAARAKASRAFAIRAALVGGLSGLLYGYDIGSIGEALPELKEEFGLRTSQEEMVVSVMLAGAVIGAALGGFLTDIVGRRRALLSTAFFFCLSTIIMSTSHTFQALLLGRFVAGVAVAWSMLAVVTYLTEVSPVEHRGTVVCANDLMISVGVLLAYCLGWLYEDWHGGWRYKVAFSIVLSLTQLVLMAYMPESPRWYLAKQRRKDAVTAMTAIYGDAQRALVELSALEETDMSHAATRGRHADPMREFRGPLLVCMGLFAFQQFCGQAGALAYMPIILRSGGITPPHVADLAMIIGLSKLMSTAVAMSLVHGKSAPRKPLLLLGGLVIGFGHFLTALSYHFSLTVRWPFTVLGTMLVICGYAVSYGPLIWVVSGEMFPTSIRGRALGLSTVINWLGNLAVGTTFLSVMEQVGGAGGFAIFGVLSLAGAVYVATCVPETGGRTPEEVVQDMKALSVQRVVKGRQGEPHVASEDMEVEIPGVGYSIAPMMHEERRHQEEKQAQSTAHLQHHGLGAAV